MGYFFNQIMEYAQPTANYFKGYLMLPYSKKLNIDGSPLFTEDEQKEFEELTKPLIKYLNVNGFSPYTTIIITNQTAELFESSMMISTQEFITD